LSGNVCNSQLFLFSKLFICFRAVRLTPEYQLFTGLENYVLAPDILLRLDSFNQRPSKTRFIIWGPSMQIWKWKTRCFKLNTILFGNIYSTNKVSIYLWRKLLVKRIMPYSRPSRVQTTLLHSTLKPASNSLIWRRWFEMTTRMSNSGLSAIGPNF
jgi:hypothetical protein